MRGEQLPDGAQPTTDPRLCGLLRAAAYLPSSNPTDLALGYILAATNGDVGLAADAIQQEPRPAWVAEFLGPSIGLIEQEATAEGVFV